MRLRGLQCALLTSLAALALCAVFAPAAVATEARTAAGTITTTLYPGWNMVGWVGPETPASELFDELRALGRISVWESEEQRYKQLMPSNGSVGDQHLLAPGDGLWLYVGGTSPIEWIREASADSVLVDLGPGRNLVAWAGRNHTPIEDAVARLGERLVRAWRWDAVAQEYRPYAPNVSLDRVRELNHGDALLVEMSSPGRWWQSGTAPPPVVFLGEFTAEKQAEIRGWVDGTRALIAERWGVEVPFTTYVGDREAVAPTYERIRGSSNVTSCGNYNNSVIFLVDGCINGGAHAHEYFHAAQFHLRGRPSKWVPGWIIEGSATYALILYRGTVSQMQTGEERIQESRRQAAALLGYYELLPLPELEPYSATVKPGNFGFTLGFMGIAWLAEYAGEQSIVDFFARLADEASWREAFEAAFGLTVDEFYEQFAAYHAEVVELLPHLTDDSRDPALVFQGDIPPATAEAVRAEFDRVRSFFSEQFGAGMAEYTIFAAAGPESVAAAHIRAFGEEPRDGFCDRSSDSGLVVVINLDCHAEEPRELVKRPRTL